MTDEEKAEEYAQNEIYRIFVDESEEVNVRASILKKMIRDSHLKGLAEGKTKWHDLRKDPDDLPKNEDKIIFFVKEYYKSIDKYIKHFSLGFYKKAFLNDDVKVFVEQSKGYENEHLTKDVIAWCELPKFEE